MPSPLVCRRPPRSGLARSRVPVPGALPRGPRNVKTATTLQLGNLLGRWALWSIPYRAITEFRSRKKVGRSLGDEPVTGSASLNLAPSSFPDLGLPLQESPRPIGWLCPDQPFQTAVPDLGHEINRIAGGETVAGISVATASTSRLEVRA
ncbi:hypothetical protein BDP81DRAFT_66389 [Colletotrichum phormii]|uniref:Uncharacterized protein n=1 Tax=Colletotrichum phormii TaxID=359342 RepID=A0AAJ0ECN5_9PEZI|nr:uncharacterized protein BDP81DRAFT_66389 [Colletotrichum phormii]KAK1634164.1 hypothetical protein BDP81DRAFT_66389 [Colletotrichum phormii]